MTLVNFDCDKCIHNRGLIPPNKITCDAFPDGIPLEFYFDKKPSTLNVCNDGVKFEKKKETTEI